MSAPGVRIRPSPLPKSRRLFFGFFYVFSPLPFLFLAMLSTQPNRILKFATFTLWVLLAVLAVLFYKERVVMFDSAYYLFQLIAEQSLPIQHQRYGAFYSMLSPFILSQIGLPLWLVALSYSLGCVLMWIVPSILSGLVFKNWWIAFLIILSGFVFHTEEFFWMVSEAQFLVPYWLFVYAYFIYFFETKKSLGWYLMWPILLLLGFVIHPLALFCFGFFILFVWVQKSISYAQIALLIVSGGVAYMLKKYAFPESQYTSTLLDNVQNVTSLFPHYFDTVANKSFIHHLLQRFLPLSIAFVLLFMATLSNLFSKRMLLYLVAIVGCILFINTCFYTRGEESLLYFENLYQPVFFAVLLAFASFKSYRGYVSGLFVALTLLAIVRWFAIAPHYQERMAWQREVFTKMDAQKILIDEANFPMEMMTYSWCMPYESVMLSTIETGRARTIYVTSNKDQQAKARGINTYFFTEFGNTYFDKLPKQYFDFSDTASAYQWYKTN